MLRVKVFQIKMLPNYCLLRTSRAIMYGQKKINRKRFSEMNYFLCLVGFLFYLLKILILKVSVDSTESRFIYERDTYDESMQVKIFHVENKMLYFSKISK